MPSTGTCVQTNCNCHIFHYILGWDIFEIMTMIETRFRPIKHVATIFLLWLICLPGCARQTTSALADHSHHAIRSRKAMNFKTNYDNHMTALIGTEIQCFHRRCQACLFRSWSKFQFQSQWSDGIPRVCAFWRCWNHLRKQVAVKHVLTFFNISALSDTHIYINFQKLVRKISMLSYAAVTPRVQCATVLRGKNI